MQAIRTDAESNTFSRQSLTTPCLSHSRRIPYKEILVRSTHNSIDSRHCENAMRIVRYRESKLKTGLRVMLVSHVTYPNASRVVHNICAVCRSSPCTIMRKAVPARQRCKLGPCRRWAISTCSVSCPCSTLTETSLSLRKHSRDNRNGYTRPFDPLITWSWVHDTRKSC